MRDDSSLLCFFANCDLRDVLIWLRAICNVRYVNHAVWSHREEEPECYSAIIFFFFFLVIYVEERPWWPMQGPNKGR